MKNWYHEFLKEIEGKNKVSVVGYVRMVRIKVVLMLILFFYVDSKSQDLFSFLVLCSVICYYLFICF